MDGAVFASGAVLILVSLPAVFRPDRQVRDSRENWETRLAELRSGAPERHFEERRELEAYPPKSNLSHRAIRMIGIASFLIGIAILLSSFII